MAESESHFVVPAIIDTTIDFDDGPSYQIVKPITDYRSCHDGVPAERRIVFLCRRTIHTAGADGDDEYILKVKVQESGETDETRDPQKGPSDTTAAEVKALETFRRHNNTAVPQMVTWKKTVQDHRGPLPGGYITFLVMTKMPGQTLRRLLFWSLPDEEQKAVISKFLPVLRSIFVLGIEPIDRGLRNIMWDRSTQTCSIIDFELWYETNSLNFKEPKELYRWGLAEMPMPTSFFEAWAMHNRDGRF